MLIDSHCHLNYLEPGEIVAALDAARQRGVTGFLVPATKLDQANNLLELCHAHDDVWCALGVHPHDAAGWHHGDNYRLAALLADPKAVAVGECGLDFFYNHAPAEQQIKVMREQWDVAQDLGLPVIVHNRDSNAAMVETFGLADYRGLKADFHSFAGGLDMARSVLERGAYLGLSGMITFPKAENVREVLPITPHDRLLVETDTPYLAPVPHRGKANRPELVVEIAARLAAELGMTADEVARLTRRNFFALFKKAVG